jgi:hypothetical protein
MVLLEVFIFIPRSVAKDSQFPFKTGAAVTMMR